jgi:hypothetical protein
MPIAVRSKGMVIDKQLRLRLNESRKTLTNLGCVMQRLARVPKMPFHYAYLALLRCALPVLTGAFICSAEPANAATVLSSGMYIDATLPQGVGLAMLLPHNDAPAGTAIDVHATLGLDPGAPKPLTFDKATDHSNVLETVRFEVSHDLTLTGVPIFKLAALPSNNAALPLQLEMYEGAATAPIDMELTSAYAEGLFWDGFRKPLHLKKATPYYAEIIQNSPLSANWVVPNSASAWTLPKLHGITASLNLPAPSVLEGALASVTVSDNPPSAVPPLLATDAKSVLAYASVVVKQGHVSYAQPISLTVDVPQQYRAEQNHIRLAAYDTYQAIHGWYTGVQPTRISGNQLQFTMHTPQYIGWRQYGFALYVPARQSGEAGLATGNEPTVAVIGDSFSRLAIVPPSVAGCIPGQVLPYCQYSPDPLSSWPGILAQMTGDHVLNLSTLGTLMVDDRRTGPSTLHLQVPQIPRDARVVICLCGVSDFVGDYTSAALPAVLQKGQRLTSAIHAQAPGARIVYAKLRCWIKCPRDDVQQWNIQVQKLAAQYGGGTLDLTTFPGGDGATAFFPDGAHPSSTTAWMIADRLSRMLSAWHLSAFSR